MYLTVQALVLRVAAYNDYDALLTLLTRDRGKITVKVRGLRRKNSPMTAACQVLAFSEFMLFEYRGNYTVNEVRSIQLFHKLRNDLQKLSLGSYFAQIAELICQEDAPNPELLSPVSGSLVVCFLLLKQLGGVLGLCFLSAQAYLTEAAAGHKAALLLH